MNGLQRRDFLTDTAAPAAAAALPGSARAALGPNEKFDLLLRKDWLQWTGVFESGGGPVANASTIPDVHVHLAA